MPGAFEFNLPIVPRWFIDESPPPAPEEAPMPTRTECRRTALDHRLADNPPRRRVAITRDGSLVGGCNCGDCRYERRCDVDEGIRFRFSRFKQPTRVAPANSKRDTVLERFRASKTDWTVAELASVTGATRLTVRKHVAELLADGIIVKVGKTKGGPGRPATLYMLAE